MISSLKERPILCCCRHLFHGSRKRKRNKHESQNLLISWGGGGGLWGDTGPSCSSHNTKTKKWFVLDQCFSKSTVVQQTITTYPWTSKIPRTDVSHHCKNFGCDLMPACRPEVEKHCLRSSGSQLSFISTSMFLALININLKRSGIESQSVGAWVEVPIGFLHLALLPTSACSPLWMSTLFAQPLHKWWVFSPSLWAYIRTPEWFSDQSTGLETKIARFKSPLFQEANWVTLGQCLSVCVCVYTHPQIYIY